MYNKSHTLRSLPVLTAGLLSVQIAGAATFAWSVPTPGANNWNVSGNWSITGSPGSSDTALFGITGTNSANSTTPNNIVSVNTAITSLTYTNNVLNSWHVTQIPVSTTLTVSGNLAVGGGTGDGLKTGAAVTDAGTLVVGGNITVGNNGSSTIDNGTVLDLSGLTTFVSGSSTATVTLGIGSRSVGDFKLAGTSNFMTAASMALNTANNSSSGSGTLTLGAGTNVINVNNFNAGANRGTCTITFAGATGGLRMRGAGGTDADRANVTLGNRNNGGGTGNTIAGTLSINGHPVDMKVATLTLGFSGSNPSGNAFGNATLAFDTGTLDATTINMATSSGTTTFAQANGSITVGTNSTAGGNGVLLIGAGGLTLANQSATSGTATGGLTNNGGVVTCSGNIRKNTTAGIGNISVSSGSLSMVAFTNTIGTTAAPIDNLTLNNATLTVPTFGGSPAAVATTLNVLGIADTINVTSVPGVGQFQLIAYTTLNGAFDFALGTLPPAFQGYISNNTTASSVDLVITNVLSKADTWKGNVNSNWDTSTLNWASGGPSSFQQGDIAIFDDTLTGSASVNLTTALQPLSVNCTNTSASYVFTGAGKLSGTASLTKAGSGSLTLTETGGDDFSSGVAVYNGTLLLDNSNSMIAGGLNIAGGTVIIGNNDSLGALPTGGITDDGALIFKRTDTVTVSSPIDGAGSLVQAGSGTLIISGGNTYAGTTTISSGALQLTGVGTISNSSQVIVSGATLDISALSQQVSLSTLSVTNSTNTLAVRSLSAPLTAANLTSGGSANYINFTSFPPIASYPVTFTIVKSGVPIGGTFNFVAGSFPTASPAYAGSVSQSVDLTSVLLTITSGPVGTRPSVLWSGSDVPNLNTNWSDRLNWQLPGAPTSVDNVTFDPTASVSASALSSPGGGAGALLPANINNIVDANFTIASLTYSNIGGNYHNTYINSGKLLSITNAGGLSVGTLDSGPLQQALATISGANAALSVSNANASFQVWLGYGASSGSQSTLDLSALDTFSAGVSRVLVGATINNVVNRPSGVFYLAKTNNISAGFQTTSIETGTGTANAAIVVSDCNGNSGIASYLYLGLVNTISADTIGIGRQKASGHLLFNPIYANTAPYPSVILQGFSSSRISVFDVGDGVGNSGTTSMNAMADLTGGFVTATVDTMNIGRASSAGTGSATSTGTLQFDAGSINVNNLAIGLQPAANSKAGAGTVNISSNTTIGASATLTVRNTLSLGDAAGGAGAAATSGTLNITNGTVLAYSVVPGTGSVSTINIAGGVLVVSNAIGNSTAPLVTLNLESLNTSDNSRCDLYLPVGFIPDGTGSSPGITVTTLNIDGLGTTTNVINIESAGPGGMVGAELPLIQYTTLAMISGATFNVGLGSMPAGYMGYLTNDTAQSQIAVVLTAAKSPIPYIIPPVLVGTNLTFSGTNGFANAPYSVLASTDLSLPLSNWTNIGIDLVFDPNGNFNFSVPVLPGQPQRYYRLRVP